MHKEVVQVWKPQTLADMRSALAELEEVAAAEGHHPATVYPDKLRVALVRERLTDGSHVMNLHFHDGERA